MKKREISAGITTITTGYIMHQVNCQNVMGAGVAKALYTHLLNQHIMILQKNTQHQMID